MSSAFLSDLKQFGPQRCEQLSYEQATDYTCRLAHSRCENFTLCSWFLPRRLRNDLSHVYAFYRWTDDLGDEVSDGSRSVKLLGWWRRELERCYAGNPQHPVFIALESTIRRYEIPIDPFGNLIEAVERNQYITRYATWDQLLDYCIGIANPVGRLLLYLCGHCDTKRQELAKQVCTALQLVYFWQNMYRDIVKRDRVYLPSDVAVEHGLSIEQMVSAVRINAAAPLAVHCAACPAPVALTALQPVLAGACRSLVDRTWPLFRAGRKLWPLLESDVRLGLKLFTLGGESTLRRIKRQGYNTLAYRPQLSHSTKLILMFRGFAGKVTG